MKRAWVFGLLVGVALSGSVFWAVLGGAFFLSPESGSAARSSVQSLKTGMTAAQPTSPTLNPAVQEALPVTVESRTLETLSKEELQTLITLSGQNAIKAAINQVGPAVVQIDVVRPAGSQNLFEEFFQNDPFFDRFRNNQPQDRQTMALGSGFFFEFNQQVYLLSNNHVTEAATDIQVTTQNDGTFSAHVIGADADMDVAVLKVDDFHGRAVPTVRLGDSATTEIGDWVVAIGNPLGLTQTVTAGIISALGRDIPNPNTANNFRALIQTDAAINPGNSGGPLVNAKGEVVGINTLIASGAEGLNFAINIDAVKRALPQLIEDGKITRAWLGVFIETVNEQSAAEFSVPDGQGVLITEVVPGSPADGPMRANDVVTHVDGVRVTTVSELQDEVMFKPVGEPVNIIMVRGGQQVSETVVLGQRPDDNQIQTQNRTQAPEVETDVLEKFGLQVAPLTEALAGQLGFPSADGVVITEVRSGSRTALANIQQGDILIELNQQPIRSVSDWNAVVAPMGEQDPLMLRLWRDGGMVFVVLN